MVSAAFTITLDPERTSGKEWALVLWDSIRTMLDPERVEWEGASLGALGFRQVVTSFVLAGVSPSHVFLFRTVPQNSVFVLLNVLH